MEFFEKYSSVSLLEDSKKEFVSSSAYAGNLCTTVTKIDEEKGIVEYFDPNGNGAQETPTLEGYEKSEEEDFDIPVCDFDEDIDVVVCSFEEDVLRKKNREVVEQLRKEINEVYFENKSVGYQKYWRNIILELNLIESRYRDIFTEYPLFLEIKKEVSDYLSDKYQFQGNSSLESPFFILRDEYNFADLNSSIS